MSSKNPQVPYTNTRPNDVMAELAEIVHAYWRQKKCPVSSTEITNVCTAISGMLATFPTA